MAGSNGTAKGTAKGSKSAGGLTASSGGFGDREYEDIAKWRDFADTYQNTPGFPADWKNEVRSSRHLAGMIEFEASDRPKNFISVRDVKGRLQASAYVTSRNGYLYLELLASAPWNVARIPGDEKVVKGAGTTAIVAVIKESVKRGYGGKVQLEALPNAVPFYEKLGFDRVPGKPGGGLPKFALSAEQADKLLKMHG